MILDFRKQVPLNDEKCDKSYQDKLWIGIEGQTINFRGVSIHCVGGLVMGERTRVPDHEFLKFQADIEKDVFYCSIFVIAHLIVGYRSKERLVQEMPGNVFHYSSVASEDSFGINNLQTKILLTLLI